VRLYGHSGCLTAKKRWVPARSIHDDDIKHEWVGWLMRWVAWLPARAGFLAPDRRSGARGHGVGLVVLASALALVATLTG
jgi:hypothetical protein